MTHTPTGLSRAGFVLVALGLAATFWGIAVSQICLGLAALLWLAARARDGQWRDVPPFVVPLLLYGAWTVVSALSSADRNISIPDLKQLLLFAVPALVAVFARGERATLVMDAVIAAGAVSALTGIWQYEFQGYNDLPNRAVGPLSHWMTFSGVLMLGAGAALGRVLYARTKDEWLWPGIAVPALVVALFYTLTRNAMVGLIAAVAVLAFARNWRLLLAAPVLGLIFLVIAPGEVLSRVQSIGDLNDPTTRDRIAMVRTGGRMVQDHPLTGVGPDMVKHVYTQYRDPLAVNETNPHLHNVPVQIAAERGLPALGLWLWFVVTAGLSLWRQVRSGPARGVAAAGLAALVAMLVAGLFEYNFGDSEFLILFLGLIALPWAAAQPDSSTA